MDWQTMVLLFVTLIISLTVHEAAHALFAFLGGDRTAYHGGQMTLNPLPHMQREPFGMVVLPILMLVVSSQYGRPMCFGYAHAPIDPYWAARHPRKAAAMSAAGPLANVALATVAWIVLFGLGRPEGDSQEAVQTIADTFLKLNVLLAVFNLIPLPPLDGAGVVSGLYPKAQRLYDTLTRIPFYAIVTFVLLIQVIPSLFWPVYFAVARLLPYPPYYR